MVCARWVCIPNVWLSAVGLCLGDRKSEDVSGGGSPALTARFDNELWTMDPREAEREDVWGGGSAARGSTTSCGRWTAGSRIVRMSRSVARRR